METPERVWIGFAPDRDYTPVFLSKEDAESHGWGLLLNTRDAVEYTRADRIAELEAENARLRAALWEVELEYDPSEDGTNARTMHEISRAALNGKKSNGD